MVLKWLLFLIGLLFFCTISNAQISGIVFDYGSRQALTQVEISNLSNLEKANGNDKGEFTIKAKPNDILVFSRFGYRSDTVLLTDKNSLRRYLWLDKNVLNTVVISGERSIRKKYAQAFNKANPVLLKQGRGLLFYPSAYFSKEGKNARRFVRMLKYEEKEKVIDHRFNLKVISSLIPLKQPELDAFYVRYRPTLKFIKRISEDDLKSYVLDCYTKFKVLPVEKQILPPLKMK